MDPIKMKDALTHFVAAINATGGVVQTHDGFYAPVADVDWIDLGEAYEKACEALGIPLVVE
jgi:hypothetical protein